MIKLLITAALGIVGVISFNKIGDTVGGIFDFIGNIFNVILTYLPWIALAILVFIILKFIFTVRAEDGKK